MFTKRKLPLLVFAVLCLEMIIYFWSVWTATFQPDNFFGIESSFIFDKCARNSGRISAAINLAIILYIAVYGLRALYTDHRRKEALAVLLTLFAVNHLAHFFFVFQNFRHHDMILSIGDNLHGFITFSGVLFVPLLVWLIARPGKTIFFFLVLHLLNVSYFICETFYNKIKPDKPAYHNQFGILITVLACLYLLYSLLRDSRMSREPNRYRGEVK